MRTAPETIRRSRHGCHADELCDLQTGLPVHRCSVRVNHTVQIFPRHVAQWRIRAVATALVFRDPHAAVAAIHDFVGVARIERECLKVGMLVPTQIKPGVAAVVRAIEPARTDFVFELSEREHNIGIRRVNGDIVVVPALLTAVIFNIVRVGTRCGLEPACTFVSGFPNMTGNPFAVGIQIVKTGIENGVLTRRM